MKKHFKVFSATTFQIIGNQLFGLLFFILLSSDVGKDIFGDINWSIAISVTISIILSFGFDYVVVRRISSKQDTHRIAGVYLSHTIVISAIFAGLLLAHRLLFPSFYAVHDVFAFIFISTLLTFIAGPFKQLAMGLEKFWHMAVMCVTCNFIRVSGFFIMIYTHRINSFNISALFIVSSSLELLVCVLLAWHILSRPLTMIFDWKVYTALVKESLPQMGTVLSDSAFARMDWILMGILSTKIFTADYSFAYKAFESSRIPLLIIAPVLLPKLSRIYSKDEDFKDDIKGQLNALWKIESFVCVLIPLILNVCWVDVVNLFTHNKYGEETKWVYLVLSMAIPMLFISNYLWTIAFAKGRLKLTFKISMVVTASNLILNIILIPRYHAVGAAIASTSSLFIQLVLYCITVQEKQLMLALFDFIKTFIIAGVIIGCLMFSNLFWIVKCCIALGVFVVLILVMGFYRDLKSVK